MRDSPRPVEIAILAVPEASSSVAFGMYDLFMNVGRDTGLIADGHPGPALMRPHVVARQAVGFTAANDVFITPHAALADCREPDVVCVPELFVVPGESLENRFAEEIEWIRSCHASGAVIATACSGALLLAEAGLLDGCEATTHWAFCEFLRSSYPRIKVLDKRALVASGEGQRLVMAGGGTSWLDLGLYLIARTVSVDEAMQVARLNLIDWHDIGQQPFARLARSAQTEDATIARCQIWIADHYHVPAPVAAMVRLSGLAERSFKRRFQQSTGMSPLEYIHTLRLEEAKHLLETGEAPIETVAHDIGYEDAGFFGRLFKRAVGLTPAQYRKRFGGMRKALQTGVV